MANLATLEPKPFLNGNDPRRNLNGRPVGSKNLSTTLREMLEAVAPKVAQDKEFVRDYCKGKKRITNQDAIAARLLHESIENGDLGASKELFDRAYGKVPTQLTGKDEQPLFTNAEQYLHLFELAQKLGYDREQTLMLMSGEIIEDVEVIEVEAREIAE